MNRVLGKDLYTICKHKIHVFFFAGSFSSSLERSSESSATSGGDGGSNSALTRKGDPTSRKGVTGSTGFAGMDINILPRPILDGYSEYNDGFMYMVYIIHAPGL